MRDDDDEDDFLKKPEKAKDCYNNPSCCKHNPDYNKCCDCMYRFNSGCPGNSYTYPGEEGYEE